MKRVADIVVRQVETCRPTETLSAAAQRLWMSRSGILPVVVDDGHGPQMVGSLSDRDVFTAAHTHCRPLHAIRVLNAMARNPWTCRLDDAIQLALDRMRQQDLDRLPVLDERGRLAGLVLLVDAVRALSPEGPGGKRVAA